MVDPPTIQLNLPIDDAQRRFSIYIRGYSRRQSRARIGVTFISSNSLLETTDNLTRPLRFFAKRLHRFSRAATGYLILFTERAEFGKLRAAIRKVGAD